MIRVVLTGAECTGKSTLAAALSAHYGAPWTPEFVRGYAQTLDRELTQEDLEPIARNQLALEDSVLEQADPLALHDTNLLSSILYASHYFGARIDWVDHAFQQRDYRLYLLCSPEGIQWQADPGQRESPEARERLHAKFKQSLEDLRLPYIELVGGETERFNNAVVAIDKLLKK